ncbi:MAG: A24 family peptidase [Geminicoccaceae bacterium]
MYVLCIACLAGLLVTGALIDIECRRLPNWLTSAVVCLYGLAVAVSPTPIDWMSAFIVAAVVFVIGFACFAFRLMGGGDVKLLAGLALWAGVEHVALFLIVTSLAGGLLSVVMLTLRHAAKSPLLLMLSFFLTPITRRSAAIIGASSSADTADGDVTGSLPYGVAIAAGGFAIIFALLQL